MPKTKISEFSSTPASNTDIDSINISEGCAPSGINDAIRELMAQLKDFQTGAVGDSFNGPVGTTTAAAGAFTTLSASGAVTLSGGTANGVTYLNGSKVLTSGSALTFDGTNLNVGSATFPSGRIRLKQADDTTKQKGLLIEVAADDSLLAIGYNSGAFTYNATYNSTGSYQPQAWWVSGSEQMRLTSTGLGIGTSSPSESLQVSKSQNSLTVIAVENANTGTAAQTRVRLNNNTSNFGTISHTGGSFTTSGIYRQDGTYIFTNGAGGLTLTTGAAQPIYFATDSTERMRIDSSGNVGIGTSSPSNRVSLKTTGGGCWLQTEDSVNTSGGNVNLFGSIGSGSAAIYTSGAQPIVFHTNTAERARITSLGYFKASNTGTYILETGTYHELRTSALDTQNTVFSHTSATSPYGIIIRYTAASPNNTDNWFFYCDDSGGTQRASLKSNGGFYNYQANDSNLSDRREKTNFAPAGSYLDKICAIPVQTFNYIDQNLEEDAGLTLGVVAQDVQAVAPEFVNESNWGTEEEPKMRLSIYQTDLQYALMKCIQEQQAIIESLKSRLDAANL